MRLPHRLPRPIIRGKSDCRSPRPFVCGTTKRDWQQYGTSSGLMISACLISSKMEAVLEKEMSPTAARKRSNAEGKSQPPGPPTHRGSWSMDKRGGHPCSRRKSMIASRAVCARKSSWTLAASSTEVPASTKFIASTTCCFFPSPLGAAGIPESLKSTWISSSGSRGGSSWCVRMGRSVSDPGHARCG